MVTGLDLAVSDEESKTCECCIKGKLTSKSFPNSKSKTKKPIDLVHTDLCRPMPVTSTGENHYFLTLIDDFSKFTVMKLLKMKDEVADAVN